MKKLLGLLVIVLVLVACNKLPKDVAVISGKVENAKELKEFVVMGGDDFSQTVTVNEDGTFSHTLEPVKTGYYVVTMGRTRLAVYLQAGTTLNFNIDPTNQENPIAFVEGESVAANKFIVARNKVSQEAITKVGGPQALFVLDEDKFIEALDNVSNAELKLLEETKDLPKDFVANTRKSVEYGRLMNYAMYPRYHAYFAKYKDFKASEKITKPVEELDYTNVEDYANVAEYKQLVVSHFQNKYYDAEDENTVVEEVKAMSNDLLKKDFAAFLAKSLSLGEKDIEGKVAQIKSLTTNEKVMEEVDAFLASVQKLGQGQPSPKFAYKNIKGKEVKLDDLKGKLVYIDVWATWCGPCKYELPHLQKLEKDYHRKNIHFVSVSVDNTEEPWKKMVTEKKLGGIQLHADNNWKSEFVQAYEIKGIPRFILLDKDGNIISADAPRPSSDEIRTLIDEWLKK